MGLWHHLVRQIFTALPPKSFIAPLVLVCVALAVGVGMLALTGRSGKDSPGPQTSQAAKRFERTRQPPGSPESVVGASDRRAQTGQTTGEPEATPEVQQQAAAVEPDEPPPPPWQAAINAITASSDDNDTVASRLVQALPGLPAEGQGQAVLQIVNLISDQKLETLQNTLLNPALSDEAASIILADLANRPTPIRAPILLSLINGPKEGLRAAAREQLADMVGKDLGFDKPAWELAVREALAQEPQSELPDR